MKTHHFTLTGRTALITGAGSGIGNAAAKFLAAAGARVGCVSHTAREVKAVCREITAAGGEALPLTADVTDSAGLADAVARLKREWGRLDIVVANAGINGVWAPLEEITEAEWDRTLAVNLKGTFLTVKHALPLLKRRGGSIVLIASVNGTRMFSNTGATAYASSKAAQVAFGKMIALELAPHAIRVNSICPGSIDTRIDDNTQSRHLKKIRHPIVFPEGCVPLTHGKAGSAEQVAELIWFLASDLSSHVTGTEVFIDGAQSLVQG